MTTLPTVRKRNFYIPYIKGVAIISIILIHLIDWSNISVSGVGNILKEFLYPGVLFFIATAGSVIYIAYGHYDTLSKPTIKLIRRGLELIGIYFLYNVVKFFIFNFSQEPFYQKFQEAGSFSLSGIFSLHSFTVPLTILFTIGILLLTAPFFLFLIKKVTHPRAVITMFTIVLIIVNWFLPQTHGIIFDFLYAKNNVTFPILLWMTPFVIGVLIALYGFEKHAKKFFLLFSILTCITYFIPTQTSWQPSLHMYPLTLYYIFGSFAFMYVLIGVFLFLEKKESIFLRKILGMIRFLGDNTLSIYVYHWIIVDLTLWLFFPYAWSIWITIPIFIIGYTYLKRDTLSRYAAHEL